MVTNQTTTKTFCFDIEISPCSGLFWANKWLGEVSVIELQDESQILCYAYKWNNEKTKVIGQDDFKGYKKGKLNDYEITKHLRDMLDEADIVIGQNSDKFDIKLFNARCLLHKIEPPSTFKNLDILKMNKKHFKLPAYNLDFISKRAGRGGKMEHEGFLKMYKKCLEGDEKYWKMIKKYCGVDIDKTYEAFKDVLVWESRAKIGWDNKKECPHCGSHNTFSRGTRTVIGGKVRRYQCQDEFCGKWFDGDRQVRKLEMRDGFVKAIK